MKNLGLTTLLLLVFATSSLAQSGSLSVFIFHDYSDDMPTIELFLEDSLVGYEVYDELDTEFNSLIEGSYRLIVKDKNGFVTTSDGIDVSNDSTTNVFLSTWDFEKECDSCVLKNDGLLEADFGFLYSQPISNDNSLVNRSLGAYFMTSGWVGKGRLLDIGGGIGYYFEQTSLDTLLPFLGANYSKQRYTNTGLRVEAKGRVAFFEHRNYDEHGVILDYGMAYLTPFIFRRVVKSEEYRSASSKLHRYTDFRPFVRIGYAPVTVSLEHRLSNFIKGELPQLPKWSLGLHFLIDE
jgi:hypothetical protein